MTASASTIPQRAALYLRVSPARQAERLGMMLLADAAQRAYASAAIVGSSMLVVDAINERASAFYEKTASTARAYAARAPDVRHSEEVETMTRIFLINGAAHTAIATAESKA